MPAVLPDGRFLRDVLRRRRGRLARARHRAHQARQASGRRHSDVRRAHPRRRPVSAEADRQGPSRRRLRAGRGPGRGQEARVEIGRPPQRHPAGHAGHADRGRAAGARRQQLSRRRCPPARRRRRGRPVRARLDRHLDRRVPRRRVAIAVASPPTLPASIRARCWSPMRCLPTTTSPPSGAACRWR